MVNARAVVDAINLLAATDKATLAEMASDDPEIAKALLKAFPSGTRDSDSPEVRDIGGDPHGRGVRSDADIGPAGSASGGGAERMIRHYSPDTAQQGLADLADKLGSALASLADTAKALQDIARKATGDEDDANEESEDDSEPREGEKDGEKRAQRGADKSRPPQMARGFKGDLSGALTGEGMLELDIKSLFNILSGPQLAKADVAGKMIAAVDEAVMSGALSNDDLFRAQQLVMRAPMVKSGHYAAGLFAKEVANVPHALARVMIGAIRG